MEEKDFNGLMSKVFNQYGFSYKIPDPQVNKYGIIADTKRPFDIFACVLGKNIYIENKFLNNGYASFPFSRLEDHQRSSLIKIKKDRKQNETLVGVGFWKRYGYYTFMVMDYSLIEYLERLGKKSILKKEQIVLLDKGYMIPINKKEFDPKLVIDKNLTIEVWNNIFGG
ncbi:MAG: hypothetical protein PF569_00015 [Candidatus Woesearchaeota archaeon]|jgi:hypothetical protein|nr:hypothetical protein [Candidatus Woesearchaeota archaeon]